MSNSSRVVVRPPLFGWSHASLVWCCLPLFGGVAFSSFSVGWCCFLPALSLGSWCFHPFAPFLSGAFFGWCCFPLPPCDDAGVPPMKLKIYSVQEEEGTTTLKGRGRKPAPPKRTRITLKEDQNPSREWKPWLNSTIEPCNFTP